MGKRAAISAGLFVAAIALAVGLYLFQPWRIFTSSTVTEDIPAAAPLAAPSVVAASAAATVAVSFVDGSGASLWQADRRKSRTADPRDRVGRLR